MPCPHHDIKIVQRSNRQSAVAAAAYQSGERLFSEYNQKQKYYSHKSEIVHTEIMLPPHAPRSYADHNTLTTILSSTSIRSSSLVRERSSASYGSMRIRNTGTSQSWTLLPAIELIFTPIWVSNSSWRAAESSL